MKTSNKIVWAGAAAYLLFAAGSFLSQKAAYDHTRDYADRVARQLSEVPVHAVVLEQVGRYDFVPPASVPGAVRLMRIDRAPEPERVRLSGDTLYVTGAGSVILRLPDLESVVADGVVLPRADYAPQPEAPGAQTPSR